MTILDQPNLIQSGQILLAILVTIAAIYDVRSRRIPNWLVLAGIAVGLLWNLYTSGWAGLGHSAAGLGLGFTLYFPLYLLRARGAGDVKLLAAVGAITGPGNCFLIFLLTALLGGAIAVVILLIGGRLRKALFNVGWIMRDLAHLRAPYQSSDELDVTKDKGMRLPHAAMIFTGVIAFIAILQYRITI